MHPIVIARQEQRDASLAGARASGRFYCPCCSNIIDRWNDWSPTYQNVICPVCFAHPRHRLISLYLQRIEITFPSLTLLHFAREKAISKQIRPLLHEYVTADSRSSGASYQLDPDAILDNQIDVSTDITEMPFPDAHFDAVICSHVLEHVPNDIKALSEIYRVLKHGGWALLQTPFDKASATTLQRDDINTPALRLKYYWQEDHVRLYGRDIFTRFSQAGFMPAIIPPEMITIEPMLFGLWPDEDLLVARKLPASYFEGR
jgi:SAM-dependent methyltransferase